MEYKGIDISKYQGDIDYTQVKKDNIKFVIIRIGYGMYENQKDPKFEKNYSEAVKNNLPVGVYIYSYAKNKEEATKEAEVTIKWLNKRKLNLPVYYDIEDKSQTIIDKLTLTEICETFCQKIEKAGYWAGIYANKYWLNTHIDGERLGKKYTIWVAQYNSQNTYQGVYDMWQYSSKGKVKGINGNVDMNILYKDIFTNQKPETKNTNQTSLPDLSNYNGQSIVDALKSQKIDSSFTNRKKLYEQLGYKDEYKGTSTQNINLLNSLKKESKYYPPLTHFTLSLVDALKKININSSFENRKEIAQKNGITDYKGTYIQNLKLLNLLKKGLLKK